MPKFVSKFTTLSSFIALCFIYGDIGTTPLYLFNALIQAKRIDDIYVLGSISWIIWILTLQVSIKYVWLCFSNRYKGEGGIFALYSGVRRRAKWLQVPAVICIASLMAYGIFAPALKITATLDGISQIAILPDIKQDLFTYIAIGVLIIVFISQYSRSKLVEQIFLPILVLWFGMLVVLGGIAVYSNPAVLRSFNPYYAYLFLRTYPQSFASLGVIILCIAGVEMLYSNLGRWGATNVRRGWLWVKLCLVINYLGQGACILSKYKGQVISAQVTSHAVIPPGGSAAVIDIHPFYALMSTDFLPIGVIISVLAAMVACQSIITGTFMLVVEAIRSRFWPRMKLEYIQGASRQLFIRPINILLLTTSCLVVLYLRHIESMISACGSVVILSVLTTTILYCVYLIALRIRTTWILLFSVIFGTLELTVLFAVIKGFSAGGIYSLLAAMSFAIIPFTLYRARKIKNRYVEFVRLDAYLDTLVELSNDASVHKHASNIVYLTQAQNSKEIEHKIIHNILSKTKRADIYWFLNVEYADNAFTSEYEVYQIVPHQIIRIEFRLGIYMPLLIGKRFERVVEDLINAHELKMSMSKLADIKFIVLKEFLSNDTPLPAFDWNIMRLYFKVKHWAPGIEEEFGLDKNNVHVEYIPGIYGDPRLNISLTRTSNI